MTSPTRADLAKAAMLFFDGLAADVERREGFDLNDSTAEISFNLEESRRRISDLDAQLIANTFDGKVAAAALSIFNEAGGIDDVENAPLLIIAKRLWRALTIIAMEDVGVSGMEAFAAVAAAGRDRRWRNRNGGDWKIACYLVRLLCQANHDQAVCDLFHHAVGNPNHSSSRSDALDLDIDGLADQMRDPAPSLIDQAIVALAIGGGLSEGQRNRDPGAVFELLAEKPYCWEVVDVSHAAWRSSRCELALLFPLVWSSWRTSPIGPIEDDTFPPTTYVGDLPGYAIDQFTRAGIQVSRKLLSADGELRDILDGAGIPRDTQHRTVGDLIFMIDGSPIAKRVRWPTGDDLRLPYRSLADTIALGSSLPVALQHVAGKRLLIAKFRQASLPSFSV